MNVIYHKNAELEAITSAQFYESQAAGLGSKFLDDLDRTVNDIVNYPEAWSIMGDDIRRHLFTHFPFGVIYRMTNSKILVLAVMNLHQKPNSWHDRM